jgi:hypothetical protein
MMFGMTAMLQRKLQGLSYINVPDYESELESSPADQRPSRSSPRLQNIFIFSLIFLFVFISVDVTEIFLKKFKCLPVGSQPSVVHEEELPHCGSSVEEARARNCIFDVMANGWTPPECYSARLTEEFLSLPDSRWYYDQDHTQEIPIDVLRLGNITAVFPAETHHDRHCLYTWRKLSEAAHSHGFVDYQSGTDTHTMHCTDYMLGKIHVKPIVSNMKFVSCIHLNNQYLAGTKSYI